MRSRRLLGAAILVVILLVTAAILWVSHSFKEAVPEVTDAKRYPQILAQLRLNGGVSNPSITLAHFPPAIPPNATNVRFFYRPHFLQGGTELQLRVTLPATQVNQLAAEILAASRPTAVPDNMASVNFRDTNNTGSAQLPPDFNLYILGTWTPPSEAEMEYAYGIAISLKRNEVIYWLEN
jgi:hypothetical protein